VRIKQEVSFVVQSETISGDEIERRLSLDADKIKVKGSRTTEPLRPRFHSWRITCDEPGLRLDEQVARVVERLRPVRQALEELRNDPQVELALSVFRDFDADDGAEDDAEDAPRQVAQRGGQDLDLVRLSGQHQLLGWHLDAEVVAFFSTLGCAFDFDEYG
jgi:hypothetical protein